MTDREKQLLKQWADYIVSDEASTDDFLFEGVSFPESLKLMENISEIIKQYVESH